MSNRDEMQATYSVKHPIEILFDQMETGQEFAIAGNSPFSDRQLADIGAQKSSQNRNTHIHIACGI